MVMGFKHSFYLYIYSFIFLSQCLKAQLALNSLQQGPSLYLSSKPQVSPTPHLTFPLSHVYPHTPDLDQEAQTVHKPSSLMTSFHQTISNPSMDLLALLPFFSNLPTIANLELSKQVHMHRSHCKNTSNVKDLPSKLTSPVEMFSKEFYPYESQNTEF